MTNVAMGHNSIHASPEEFATLVRKAKRADVLEIENKGLRKDKAEMTAKLERATGTINRISEIGNTDLSATAKTVATHLEIASMDPSNDGRVSAKQIQQWASLKSRKAVPSILDELSSARLLEIAQRPSGRNFQYTVNRVSDADLQAAVEALRSTTARNVCEETEYQQSEFGRDQNAQPNFGRHRGSRPNDLAATAGRGQTEKRFSRDRREQPNLAATKTPSQMAEINDYQPTAQPTDSVRTLYSEKDSSNRTGVLSHTTESVAARDERVSGWSEDPYYRMLKLSGDQRQIVHPQFTVPVEAVFLAVTAANPRMTREEVFQVCLAEAIGWATNLDIGQPVAKVVPDHIVRWITAVVQKGNIRKQVGDVQIARAGKSPQNVPNWHNRFDPRGSMRDS